VNDFLFLNFSSIKSKSSVALVSFSLTFTYNDNNSLLWESEDVKEALELCNFSLDELRIKGIPPQQAMKKFTDWIAKVSGTRKPVFVAYPVTFDWLFVNYYFYKYIGLNPFGVSGIDIKSVWIGKTNAKWHSIGIDDIQKSLGLEYLLHIHNVLEDAKAQTIVFKKMIDN
jgi:ribonuclease T